MPRLSTLKLYSLLQPQLSKIGIGRDLLFRILRANHLLIKPLKSYHKTTNTLHRFRKHKNLVEEMKPMRPKQLWVADITYVGTRKNPIYLSLVTDAYSKKIIGYHLSESLATQGSLIALQMGIKNRKYKRFPLIYHSDRGLHYCSDSYQELLSNNMIKFSMTEFYDPYAMNYI
jgi:transposase InsO family protein